MEVAIAGLIALALIIRLVFIFVVTNKSLIADSKQIY